jgi:hypothetical protein
MGGIFEILLWQRGKEGWKSRGRGKGTNSIAKSLLEALVKTQTKTTADPASIIYLDVPGCSHLSLGAYSL